MNREDELHAQKLINQLKSGAAGAVPPNNTYEPQPGQIDNQGALIGGAGVNTREIPGIGVVSEGAEISTNTQSRQVPINPNIGGGVNICPQCGNSHPPIQPGQKCPMSPIESPSGQKLDINPILEKMRVILTSQLEQKSVTDMTKFSQFIIIELTKLIEGYKE